ncbi:MAG: acyl-CoA thioesterase [Crocinitomicaceae bacterium]|jgi:acyl-CoA thioester hydrolase
MNIHFIQKTSLRVRYGETDQMGYCYYGNYAQYFEVGRVEALRSFGMSYKKMEDSGVMLPVSEFNVRYFAPAYYDDILLITTKITSLKGARLFFEYEIENEHGKVISVASTTLVFVSKDTMRPISPPDDFIGLMQKHQVK